MPQGTTTTTSPYPQCARAHGKPKNLIGVSSDISEVENRRLTRESGSTRGNDAPATPQDRLSVHGQLSALRLLPYRKGSEGKQTAAIGLLGTDAGQESAAQDIRVGDAQAALERRR